MQDFPIPFVLVPHASTDPTLTRTQVLPVDANEQVAAGTDRKSMENLRTVGVLNPFDT